MNERKPLFIIFFIAVYLIGLAFGYLSRTEPVADHELRELFEQALGDLNTAVESQREAAVRAARLQSELQGITDHAGFIQEGTGRIEARAVSLEDRGRDFADQLNRIIEQSGELSDGINRAYDSLEESRILIDELRIILQSLP